MNLPPTIKFYGDIDIAKGLKAKALQLYNFNTTVSDVGGNPSLYKSIHLSDGSTISFKMHKESNGSLRSGAIKIYGNPNKKELPKRLYIVHEDLSESTASDLHYSVSDYLKKDPFESGGYLLSGTGLVTIGNSWNNGIDSAISWYQDASYTRCFIAGKQYILSQGTATYYIISIVIIGGTTVATIVHDYTDNTCRCNTYTLLKDDIVYLEDANTSLLLPDTIDEYPVFTESNRSIAYRHSDGVVSKVKVLTFSSDYTSYQEHSLLDFDLTDPNDWKGVMRVYQDGNGFSVLTSHYYNGGTSTTEVYNSLTIDIYDATGSCPKAFSGTATGTRYITKTEVIMYIKYSIYSITPVINGSSISWTSSVYSSDIAVSESNGYSETYTVDSNIGSFHSANSPCPGQALVSRSLGGGAYSTTPASVINDFAATIPPVDPSSYSKEVLYPYFFSPSRGVSLYGISKRDKSNSALGFDLILEYNGSKHTVLSTSNYILNTIFSINNTIKGNLNFGRSGMYASIKNLVMVSANIPTPSSNPYFTIKINTLDKSKYITRASLNRALAETSI